MRKSGKILVALISLSAVGVLAGGAGQKADHTGFLKNYAQLKEPNASLTLTRSSLNDIILGVASLDDKIESGEVHIGGNRSSVDEFVGRLDNF